MTTIYDDGGYLKNNPSWHSEDSIWKADKIITILEKNNITYTSVVDVGCGAGKVLGVFCEKFSLKTFYGYEISPQAFELTHEINLPNIKFFLQDFFKSNKLNYDISLAIDVFEHVENPYCFLKDMSQVSKYSVFHIPLSASALNVLKNGLINEKNQWGHIHYYCKETALELLNDCGYEIIDFQYTDFAFELEQSIRTIPINLFRRFLNLFNKDFSVRVLGGSSLLVLAAKKTND